MKEEKWVRYYQQQFYLGELVLLSGIPYKINLDTLEARLFVVNQNNQIIYIDRLTGMFSIEQFYSH